MATSLSRKELSFAHLLEIPIPQRCWNEVSMWQYQCPSGDALFSDLETSADFGLDGFFAVLDIEAAFRISYIAHLGFHCCVVSHRARVSPVSFLA